MRNILAILLLLGLSLRAADVPLSSQTRTAYIHPLNTLVAVSTNLSSTYYSRAINASNFLESILTYPNWPSLTKVQTTNLVNTTVNLASNALQTQITAILSATNFANVIDYGATADGTSLASPGTDDTAAFANAIASGQAVYVPKTAGYFSITNLTNSTLIFGGGRILMRPTSTNFAIYFGMMAHSGNGYAGTNVDWSGIGMQDIELWGGGTNFLGGLGNRHGVNFNLYGQGNILQNCYIHGFNGVGVQSTSTKPFAEVPPFLDIDQAPGVLNNVTVSNCYYGFHYVGGQPIGIPASSDVYLSEYLRSQGLMATGNKVGMWLEAGNNQIMNSHFSRNTNGFLITSNQNNGHGAFIGGSINHNDGSGVIASNISFGFVFQGVNMFFNSLYLTNSDGILYQGGIFDHGTVTFGGGGANVFRDNEWLTGAPSIVTTASGKGVAYNYGPADGSSLPVAFPWFLMSTNQHAVRSTNGFFSWSTNKGAVVLGGNYSPTIAENVFNGNSAFNIQANMGYNGSFTFDAAGANRVGFTIRNGFYPWLTFATNTPLYIGENSLADLQDLSANSTHANRPYMSFMGSKITNHVNMYGPMFDAAGNAYSTTGGGGGGGTFTNFQFTVDLDGFGGPIATGLVSYVRIPSDCTITGWDIISANGVTGSLVLDVWKDTYANFPPTSTDSIAGSEKPTLSSATKNQDTALSTWTTTACTKGEYLGFHVDSASTLTRATVFIYYTVP